MPTRSQTADRRLTSNARSTGVPIRQSFQNVLNMVPRLPTIAEFQLLDGKCATQKHIFLHQICQKKRSLCESSGVQVQSDPGSDRADMAWRPNQCLASR